MQVKTKSSVVKFLLYETCYFLTTITSTKNHTLINTAKLIHCMYVAPIMINYTPPQNRHSHPLVLGQELEEGQPTFPALQMTKTDWTETLPSKDGR